MAGFIKEVRFTLVLDKWAHQPGAWKGIFHKEGTVGTDAWRQERVSGVLAMC